MEVLILDTDVIMCIIALCAIVSPVIVAFINNQHDYAVRKLENVVKPKQEALSKFADVAITNWSREGISTSFYNALSLLYVYFEIDDKLVSELTENHSNNVYEYQKSLAKFMKSLSKQI